jgi:hypothetical protein
MRMTAITAPSSKITRQSPTRSRSTPGSPFNALTFAAWRAGSAA